MAVRQTVSLADYEKVIAEAGKYRQAAKLTRQRTAEVKASNGILAKDLAESKKEIRGLLASLDAQKTQVVELHRIIDQLKRENERLRLGRHGDQKLGGNLKNIEAHVWDGMWARTVSGGSAGTLGR